MPLFTRIGYLIGGALSVAVFGTAVIGVNYQGVILNHLADTVRRQLVSFILAVLSSEAFDPSKVNDYCGT